MNVDKYGGPAFPVPAEWTDHGMSLRDYFAAKAMQALVTHNVTGRDGREGMALFCYAMADAMMEARKK